jgi:hypothetical protein
MVGHSEVSRGVPELIFRAVSFPQNAGEPVSPVGPIGFPLRDILNCVHRSQHSQMRVNLSTQPSGSSASGSGTLQLTLTICPACGLPGDYECQMDSEALMRLLRQQTDLPASVLESFERKLRVPPGARLLAVELSETVLTDIGYFID